MRTYALENRGRAPLYEYLYRCIRGDILDGTLTAGERLPSKRALAEHLHISVMTVEGAYQQLEAEGYVYTQPKRGFFVAEVERPRPAVPAPPAPEAPPEAPVWRLDLKSNQVDASRFPAAAWARLTRQVLSEDGEALLRPVPHQGLPALRQAIARDLREYKGMAVPPEQIVVGPGRSTCICCWLSCWDGRPSLPWRIRAIPKSARCTASAARLAARCPWTARAFPRRPWRRREPVWSISLPPTTIPPDW